MSEYKRTWVDPPEGWRYGFPKMLDDDYFTMGENTTPWFIKHGYPKELIEKGMLDYCRFGLEEITK